MIPLYKSKKTRANAGETLVEVMVSIFLFLLMMGILQGAVSYSHASLEKNKEIRANNAEIIQSLSSTTGEQVEKSGKSIQFAAVTSDMKTKGNNVFVVKANLVSKTIRYTDADGNTEQTTFYLYRDPESGTRTTGGTSTGGDKSGKGGGSSQ